MRIVKVGIGEIAIQADEGTPVDLALGRVNKVTELLADIVFNQPGDIGLSAMVSLLGTQLSVYPEPLAKTAAIATVLRSVVEMNLNREEAVSVYIL